MISFFVENNTLNKVIGYTANIRSCHTYIAWCFRKMAFLFNAAFLNDYDINNECFNTKMKLIS